jgi:SpoVK/Ycf46/Vps4 family AAA+-type ATPase
MYVGETEQNIARAFERAQEAGAVLMIDEVDSFLQDRRNATRSWETTQVNEMLTQIESYSGVLIVSTNLMDNIDPASLRRFDLKAKFDYLKPEQAVTLLSRCAEQLKISAPTERENREIQQLRTITPGDFATIMRQNRFRPMTRVAEIIGALHAECSLKPSTGKAIGFY